MSEPTTPAIGRGAEAIEREDRTSDSDRCASTRLDGKRCDRSPGHTGAHLHETTNGIYGWGNTA